MSNSDGRAVPEAPASSQELFVSSWDIYRKMVDNDYLGHQGAYSALRELLLSQRDSPFSFMDIACGDASMSAQALAGTAVSDYTGIDISADALSRARKIFASVDCRARFILGDFRELLPDWYGQVDVVWIGLSLHHLQVEDKVRLMAHVRRIIAPDGMFAIYEDTCFEGENREDWLSRWDAQESSWTAYTPEEWKFVCDHVHGSDYPQSDSQWEQLGREAGFSRIEKLFECRTQLFGFFCFQP
jgi:SAM-dependent methyltransferase